MTIDSVKKLLHNYWQLILLLILTGLVFAPGMTESFSSDDYVHLDHNIHFKNTFEALSVFTESYGREYRPLVRFSLWLNHAMGETALPFKLTNLAMHLLCTVFLYWLLLRLGVSQGVGIVASALFALHPIHITSVQFILGRTDLVAAVFYFTALLHLTYWKPKPTYSQYLISMLLFIAALCSKELSISLPVIMLAILLIQQPTLSFNVIAVNLIKLWPFILISTIYLVIRLWMWHSMPGAIEVYTQFSPMHFISNYAQWFFALVYLFDLYIAQDFFISSPGLFITLAAGSSVLALIGIVFIWKGKLLQLVRAPLLLLGVVWFSITLLPMSGGNPHRWYLYVPSAGLSFLFAAAYPLASQGRKSLLAVLVGLWLLISGLETLRESLIWRTQSKIERAFMQQIEDLGIHQLDAVSFANVPFGYRSAFLFSHSSLEEAIGLKYGQAPKIKVLSYLNLDDTTQVIATKSERKLTFTLAPNAVSFFMLSASERRFDKLETRNLGDFNLAITKLTPANQIREYSLNIDDSNSTPSYFYDGTQIKKF
jgi:protein O-mannosyl-transferase